MKDIFKEYHQYTDKEFEKLWKECIFVLDANTLLDMYRYSRGTVDIYFKVLTKLKKNNQLWIPYQVGYEFYENRIDVISEYEKSYDDILLMLTNTKESIENKYKDHPFLDLSEVNKKIKKGLSSVEATIKKGKSKHPKWLQKDDVLEKIKKLFDGSVGENYDEERLEKIKKEGIKRYSKRIPPGFKDDKKDEDKKFGDLILWHQIIDKAKDSKRPIIFISGDIKEDWWLQKNGKRIMPLPQLKKEMYDKASVDFHIYTSDRFLQLDETNGSKIDAKTLKEVRKIRELDEVKMSVRRKELAEKRKLSHLFLQRRSLEYIQLVDEATALVTHINYLGEGLNSVEESNQILHRLVRVKNRIRHEDFNSLLFSRLKKDLKTLSYFLNEIVHLDHLDNETSLKIREFIYKLERLEHDSRYNFK